MASARRLRLIGCLVALGEGALGLLATGTVLAPFLWLTAAATLALAFVAARFMVPPGPPDPPDDRHGPEGPEPPWWPAFERDLRAHLREAGGERERSLGRR